VNIATTLEELPLTVSQEYGHQMQVCDTFWGTCERARNYRLSRGLSDVVYGYSEEQKPRKI
jgi:hypothetical protein